MPSLPQGREVSKHARIGCRYAQAGTPQVKLSTNYDSAARTFAIKASQSTPPTPGQESKSPILIPLKVALLGADGSHLPLHLKVTPLTPSKTCYEIKAYIFTIPTYCLPYHPPPPPPPSFHSLPNQRKEPEQNRTSGSGEIAGDGVAGPTLEIKSTFLLKRV
jgi:hypothetical protein